MISPMSQPVLIFDIRRFLKLARAPSTSKIIIKTSRKHNRTKFKVRTPSKLYTLKVADPKKAQKIRDSFPPGLYGENNIDILSVSKPLYHYHTLSLSLSVCL